MKYLKLIFFILPLLIFNSCIEATINNNEENPPVQTEIIWESLAKSNWSVYRADAQLTGRSKIPGPRTGVVVKTIDSINIEFGAIVVDYYYYFLSNQSDKKGLFRFDRKKDTLELFLELESASSSILPVALSDSSIAFGFQSSIVKFNKDSILWSYNNFRPFGSMTGVNKNSEIIVGGYQSINKFSKDGVLLSITNSSDFTPIGYSISPDGLIIYLNGLTGYHAVDIDFNRIVWKFISPPTLSSPIVDKNGNVYVISSKKNLNANDSTGIFALSPSGNIKWTYLTGYHDLKGYRTPAIDINGNILFGTDTLYSVNNNGRLNWKKEINSIWGDIITDSEGFVYVAKGNGTELESVLCFDSSGNKIFEVFLYMHSFNGVHLIIDNEGGLIVIPKNGNKFVIIG